MVKTNEVIAQSKNAFAQWGKQWREQAAHHRETMPRKISQDLVKFRYSGVGKTVVCVANGWSLERNIDKLKDMQDLVDIIVCDKALGHLLDNGIKPTYCFVCDANVSYEKYLEPWKDQLKDIVLLYDRDWETVSRFNPIIQ